MLIQILCYYLATLIDCAHLHILRYHLSIIYLYTVVETSQCILLPVPQSGLEALSAAVKWAG